MTLPSVSIISVTINRESLKDACASVDRQTYPNWHHYVLGDGVLPVNFDSKQRSTLGFSKIMGITEPGANMPNGTPNPMLRWALKNIDLGDYVCFLDDDNIYKDNYLETMVNALEANPDKGIALCAAEDFRYAQNIDGYPSVGRCDNSAFLVRRQIAKSIEFPYASMEKNVVQDCEFIMKCAEHSGWICVPEKLLIFGAGLNLPPDRGQQFFLESWKKPQEAYKMAFEHEYVEAIPILEEAVKLNKNDAWSVWKLAEISIVTGERERAEFYFKQWEELFIKSKSDHYYVTFLQTIYLRYFGKRYKQLLESAVNRLGKITDDNPNDIENYFCLAIFHLFNGNEQESGKFIRKALEMNNDRSFWAYKEAVWLIRVFSEIFKLNGYCVEELREERSF
ncbi:glycosyltransferase [Paenibacillus lautus]|uniref:glycosyltransferase n=1 Tax=Paenibacillus lautus TaxID=1401 RepID=UPI003D281D94